MKVLIVNHFKNEIFRRIVWSVSAWQVEVVRVIGVEQNTFKWM